MYRYVRVGLACFKFIVPARSFHFNSFHFLSISISKRSQVSIKVPMQNYSTYGCSECGAYYASFRKLLEHLDKAGHMGQPGSRTKAGFHSLKKRCLTADRSVAIECLRILAAAFVGRSWPKTQAHLGSVIKATLPSFMSNAMVRSWLDRLHRKTSGITIVAAGNRLTSQWRQLNILWGSPQTLSWVSFEVKTLANRLLDNTGHRWVTPHPP